MPLSLKLLKFCVQPGEECFAIGTLPLPERTQSLGDLVAYGVAVLSGRDRFVVRQTKRTRTSQLMIGVLPPLACLQI